MFYEPDKNNHGLRFNPFKSICVPRPIAWVSSLSLDGVPNLAPFSQFTNLSFDPPMVVISARFGTDTARNVNATSEFVVNMATYELREAVNITGSAVEPEIDEAKLAGLEMIPSKLVKPPRVAASPVHLECRYHCTLALPGRNLEQSHYVVIGQVIGVHIKDEAITPEGRIDVLKLRPLARLGYHDYTSVESCFTMPPIGPHAEIRMAGLAGKPLADK